MRQSSFSAIGSDEAGAIPAPLAGFGILPLICATGVSISSSIFRAFFRSGWLTGKTRAPHRVGFANARELGWIYYNDRVRVRAKEMHAVDRYLQVAEAIGCGREPIEFVFATDNQDRAWVAEQVGGFGRYAVVLPGSNWVSKRWPIEYFSALVEPLRERFGLATIAAGGPSEIAMGEQVRGSLNLAGKTNLRQLVALIEGADLVIANDSGPMHIAAALGKPLVTMYGATNPVRTGPYGRADSVLDLNIPCSPCYSRTCAHCSCMKWISVESVLKLAERQLRTGGPASVPAGLASAATAGTEAGPPS